MPTGEASIIFNLHDGPMGIYDGSHQSDYTRCGTAAIFGPHTKCCIVETQIESKIFGIQFHPGGIFPFLVAPCSELTNGSAPLEFFWPQASKIRERLLAAQSVDEMFATVEHEMLTAHMRPLELHPAVEYARNRICVRPNITMISSLADNVGLSQRRFSQLFREQIGISPKAFCRVRRFQRALATIHPTPRDSRGIDWVDLALGCGYYDQAHFIHDFRAFAGSSPSDYLALRTEYQNHVALD